MPDYSIVESENAELLQDIIDGETSYTKDTHSRNAEILKSIINGTEYDEEPQSEIEELLLELKSQAGDFVGKFLITESGDTKILTGVCADNMTISGVDSVADSSFRYILIKNLTIAEGVKSLGTYSFADNTALEEVKLPTTLTSISGYAFYRDTNLQKINIPDGVKTIPTNCFVNCSKLTDFTCGNITAIDASAFYNCGFTSFEIPSTIQTLGQGCFRKSKLTSLDLSVFTAQTINDEIVRECADLVSIVMPPNITKVPDSFLRGCSALTSIDIPEAVANYGTNTFNGCTSLRSITMRNNSSVVKTSGSSTLLNVPADCAIYVPSGMVDTYKASSYWSSRAEYIQAIPA